MLTIDDIPEKLQVDQPEVGPTVSRFARAVIQHLGDVHSDVGRMAGARYGQAAFHLRYSAVGLNLHDQRGRLEGLLRESDQFIHLGGYQLAVTSAAACIDLCAATLHLLAEPGDWEPDLRQVAKASLLQRLPVHHRKWVTESNELPEVDRLMEVRNALVHRLVPLSVAVPVGGGPPLYTVEVRGRKDPVDPPKSYAVAVDRFVSLGLLLLSEEYAPPRLS